ncbi:MAG: DnaJ domain-containing protein [Chryseolinea sp.]
MKDYYKILGVRSTAPDADIKRAFRQLAVRYHPDKNPDPAAELLFKEINEAYTILSDPQKRAGYDWKRQRPLSDLAQEPAQPPHRDPAYRKPRPKGPHRKSEGQQMFEMMSKYQPVINRITTFCFSIAMLLLIDYILPSREQEEKIVEAYSETRHVGRSSITLWIIETTSGIHVTLPFEDSDYFQVGQNVKVHSSFILDFNRKVEGNEHAVSIRRSIYGNFIFAPIALLVISSFAMMFRKNVERSFNFGLVSMLILIFNGVIILLL